MVNNGIRIPGRHPGLKDKHYMRLLRSQCKRSITNKMVDVVKGAGLGHMAVGIAAEVYAKICPVCQSRITADRQCGCQETF
jgi:hypothetical protein